MDIRCPSCSTVYEFDESRIGPDGINLRCSACGQVFRVRASARPREAGWTVRQAARGDETHFDDLASVQRWIVEKRLDRNDLISRSGDNWRRLADVHELATFFQVVDELPDDPITNPRMERPEVDFGPPVSGPPTRTIPQGSGLKGTVDPNATLAADARAIAPLDLAPVAAPPMGRAPHTTLEGAGAPAVGRATRPNEAVSSNPPLPPPPPPPVKTGPVLAPSAAPTTQPVAGPAVHVPPTPEAPPAPLPAPRKPPGFAALTESQSLGAQTGRSAAVSGEGYALGPPRKAVDSDSFFMDARDAGDMNWQVGDAPIATRSEPGAGYVPSDTASIEAVRRPGSGLVRVLFGVVLVLIGALIGVLVMDPGRFGLETEADAVAEATPETSADEVVAPSDLPVAPPATAVALNTPTPSNADDAPTTATGVVSDHAPTPTEPAAEQAPVAPAEPAEPTAEAVPATPTEPASAVAAEPPARPEPTAPAAEPEPPRRPPSLAGMPFDAQMDEGNAALRSGNLDRALEAYSAAADAGDRAEAHVGVARTYERMGRNELAIARYERAVARNARYQPAWQGLGNARARSGDTAGAEQAYRQVLEIRDTGGAADEAREGLRALGLTP